MKATLDIPDELYRRVKARSALEGRPLRAVAIELFQNWLRTGSFDGGEAGDGLAPEELKEFPWLEISRKYVKPGIRHEMEDIRESIASGWAAESAGKSARSLGKS